MGERRALISRTLGQLLQSSMRADEQRECDGDDEDNYHQSDEREIFAQQLGEPLLLLYLR